MDAVPLRQLQRSMTRESTETSRLVASDRQSQDRPREHEDDEDDVDDFLACEAITHSSEKTKLISDSQ